MFQRRWLTEGPISFLRELVSLAQPSPAHLRWAVLFLFIRMIPAPCPPASSPLLNGSVEVKSRDSAPVFSLLAKQVKEVSLTTQIRLVSQVFADRKKERSFLCFAEPAAQGDDTAAFFVFFNPFSSSSVNQLGPACLSHAQQSP